MVTPAAFVAPLLPLGSPSLPSSSFNTAPSLIQRPALRPSTTQCTFRGLVIRKQHSRFSLLCEPHVTVTVSLAGKQDESNDRIDWDKAWKSFKRESLEDGIAEGLSGPRRSEFDLNDLKRRPDMDADALFGVWANQNAYIFGLLGIVILACFYSFIFFTDDISSNMAPPM
eukprot:CAMPEP_0196657112 /NCGR_PEP_ID=MMETSP1086-20130531/21876_1 /TAXON_ID=77921 /ORGANISM="Cyanoptyche  gloeocystis , Strain SAG4.97" /LENGTH=169 /DNA_ID=CAMNT_0041990135 /DNA_START=33 /DNA_END=542 /DNA_ORIENTATION=+